MKAVGILCRTGMVLALLPTTARAADSTLREGASFDVGARTAKILQLDSLPFVQSDYTRRFKFDSFENPKLHELRRIYGLDTVVAGGQDEFACQTLLMDWVHHQFKKFGRPSASAKGALAILKAVDEGNTFFCAQYAEVLVSSAASLGWVARPLALRRHQGVAKVGGSTEHSVTEIWSNQHRKWVMLDPTSNMYLETNGTPLNAYEIRQEWFYHGGSNLVFVVGKEQRSYGKSDLPIQLKHFEGFGELAVHPDELDKYGFIGYIPNTDLMDSGYDYANMFITKDGLCDGTKWHVRPAPADPAVDPYFPIGQADVELHQEGIGISVLLRTLTPNFKSFQIRVDNGNWRTANNSFFWTLHPGTNRVDARTVNKFGVYGPISDAKLIVTE